MEDKTWFFGWTNIKWFIREMKKIYSNEPSYFSKKRIESGIAFGILQFGMIFWLIANVMTIDAFGIVTWGALEATICGYVINQIQKEKKDGNEG